MFGEPSEVARRVAERRLSSRRPRRWTDDTAMALSVVEVLGRGGTIDEDALAAAFARRFRDEPNRGYGQGAFALLTRLNYGVPWHQEAQRLFGGQGSFGNGAAMRAAPIGGFFAGAPQHARDEALRSAAPTHAHPDGAAGAVAVSVAAAVIAAGGDGAAMFEAAIALTPPGLVLDGVRRAAGFGTDADPAAVAEAVGTGRDVAAHDTVPWCLWVVARHRASYEEALWTATAPIGDRDTNGAIVGGIVVLATGADAMPAAWRAAAEPVPDPLA
jgi:ADP-ribosylglycohydrolase